jgi:hypothetical protein
MSAAATPTAAVATAQPAGPLLQRDDGPLARALGRLGAGVPVSAFALLALGALPGLLLLIVRGDGATDLAAGIGIGWLVLLGGLSSGRPHTDKLRWAVPPLLRAVEYGGLLWIGALAGDGLPGAFAVLCVLWFRHYDLVYRVRHQGVPPPRWLGDVALGWEGRLLGAYVLLVTGALPAGFYLYAALLAVVLVAETIDAWTRFSRARRPMTYDEEEDEGQ